MRRRQLRRTSPDRRRRFRWPHQSAGARRVAAVQRTLTEYGYGQLKPTGAVGADTQAAIQKFERDRKLPVTGQMSDRLVRELTAMIGHPIE
jgi:peptidoglycan hydrolase-like protein with peptidoglycan-binding domain